MKPTTRFISMAALALSLLSPIAAIAEESVVAAPSASAPPPSISQRMLEIETAAYLKQYEKLFNAILEARMEVERLQSETAPQKDIDVQKQKYGRLENQMINVKDYLLSLDERIKEGERMKKETVATK